MKKTILGVKASEKECDDPKCPFHGELNVKDELFRGKVVKKDINHSATIQWERSIYIKKYERYDVKKSRMRVHNPKCIDAEVGQYVLVARTRPISKTKNHVILTIMNKEQDVQETKK